MSLLDRGDIEVIVYPEVVTTSPDGNLKTKASDVGVPIKARVDILGQSGTSSRRQEQDNEGYESEKVYSIRFARREFQEKFNSYLGAQSRIEWGTNPATGKPIKWALFGDENVYSRSRRTRHKSYTMKRY